jgi:hypothetical protein
MVTYLGDNAFRKDGTVVKSAEQMGIPPFIEVTLDSHEVNVVAARAYAQISQLEFDSQHRVAAIPWKSVLAWLNLMIPGQAAFFLQKLTIAYAPEELIKRERKRKATTDIFNVTSICSNDRHRSICSSSPIILSTTIDLEYYRKWQKIICQQCAINIKEQSLDGKLHIKHARPLLNHMQRTGQALYQPVVTMLLKAFETTRHDIMFFSYYDFSKRMTKNLNPVRVAYNYADVNSLLAEGLNLCRLDLCRIADFNADFNMVCKNKAERRKIIQAAAMYKVFGKVMTVDHYALPFLQGCPRPDGLLANKFRIIVVSVFEPMLVCKVFQEVAWGYVHVYEHENQTLNVNGVDNVEIDELHTYIKAYPKKTVVAWPGHEFSLSSLQLLQSLEQPVIVAGIPDVIGSTHAFTTLLEAGHAYTFFGSSSELSKKYEGIFPSVPIPIHAFLVPAHSSLKCPTYSIGKELFFHRSLLFTLLANFYSQFPKSRVTILPGSLATSSEAELALCG